MSTLWFAHGLTIRCDEVALDAARADPEALPDITFHLAPPAPVPGYGATPPRGRPIAIYDDGVGSAFSVFEREDALVEICFHGVASAILNRAAGEVLLTLAPDADPGLAAVLISGTLLSVILTLRGHPVLHASAVTIGRGTEARAIAFVGRSGMGKSTMAAVMCRDGARFLTDDVLRTDLAKDGTVWAWPGATAVRLRPAAWTLGADVAKHGRDTADGRLAVTPTPASPHPVQVLALVVPLPHPEAPSLQVTRLRGVDAVLTLASFPRIPGWLDSQTSGSAHQHWGALVEQVPLLSASIPWGPPFANRLGDLLIQEVRRALAPK